MNGHGHDVFLFLKCKKMKILSKQNTAVVSGFWRIGMIGVSEYRKTEILGWNAEQKNLIFIFLA